MHKIVMLFSLFLALAVRGATECAGAIGCVASSPSVLVSGNFELCDASLATTVSWTGLSSQPGKCKCENNNCIDDPAQACSNNATPTVTPPNGWYVKRSGSSACSSVPLAGAPLSVTNCRSEASEVFDFYSDASCTQQVTGNCRITVKVKCTESTCGTKSCPH